MDIEKAKYIIIHFPNLLTTAEKLAIRHTSTVYKLEHSKSSNTEFYERNGWLTTDQSVLNLLKDGYEQFELNVANRILNEKPNSVFFNNCPKCNKLARTPYARQCRFCGNTWHEVNIALFKLENSFQTTGRYFFLIGKITKGNPQIGSFIDLTMLGLNKKPKIEAIEYVLKQQNDKAEEDIALGTNELTYDDKEYLINIGSFGTPFDIVKER